MSFNSIDFALFLPIVFILYWFIIGNSIKFQNGMLLITSYIFYGWWDWRFLSLIFISSIVDFLVGIGLGKTEKQSQRRLLLLTSLLVNLGFLAYFKYFNFFLESFIKAFSFFGFTINKQGLNIILPVGISFYTFQTLSYSIDVYRKHIKPTKDILAFFAFVSFFPQLVAGPIERASNLLPQFFERRTFLYKNISIGTKQIIWGFFLKLVVADRAAIYVNAVYNNVDQHGGLSFIAATILFAFQIYGDFAGYSLIAIGTAKLFDFNLMTNFNRPYFASSLTEFWRRWHISLSSWFRDYLYIPLGGNRVCKPRWLANLLITFTISGLWHGANWTFVIWGALNGVFLMIEALFVSKNSKSFLRTLSTFILINFAWIFFRARSLEEALHIILTIFSHPGRLFIGEGTDVTAPVYTVIAILILILVEVKKEYFDHLLSISENESEIVRMTAYALLIFLILYLGVFGESQFIYFQF